MGGLGLKESKTQWSDKDLITAIREGSIGTETADKLENLASRGLQKVKKTLDRPSLKFVRRTGSAIADQYKDSRTLKGKEWFNPADVVTAGALRTAEGGLKIAGGAANLAGKGGEALARTLRIDPRWGRWGGELAGDAVLGWGVGKASRVASSANKIRRLNKAGAVLEALDAVNLGKGKGRAFAFGPEGAVQNQAKLSDALLLNKKGHKALDKFTEGLGAIKPDKDGFFHITKNQMPQMKGQLEEWLKKEYKAKGRAAHIKRKEFGTIVVDGDEREITAITQFLERGGNLPFPAKVVNTKQAKFLRVQRERPPKLEMDKLRKSYGLSVAEMNEYYEDSVRGFASVREAARREGLSFRQIYKEAQTGKRTPKTEYTPGGTHAGHYQAAEKGGSTTGRTAGLEPGKANISKGSKFEGNVNVYAAELAGIPTTWAQDFKMWFAQKKGLPHRDFHAEFTNAQREKILSIPWTAKRSEVEAFFKKHKLDPSLNPNLKQLKDIQRDLKGL